MHDPVDTKDMLIFDVRGALESGIQDVQPAIEVASPQTPGAIHIQSGNIAIGKHRARRVQSFSEFAAFEGLLIQTSARERIQKSLDRKSTRLNSSHLGI